METRRRGWRAISRLVSSGRAGGRGETGASSRRSETRRCCDSPALDGKTSTDNTFCRRRRPSLQASISAPCICAWPQVDNIDEVAVNLQSASCVRLIESPTRFDLFMMIYMAAVGRRVTKTASGFGRLLLYLQPQLQRWWRIFNSPSNVVNPLFNRLQ